MMFKGSLALLLAVAALAPCASGILTMRQPGLLNDIKMRSGLGASKDPGMALKPQISEQHAAFMPNTSFGEAQGADVNKTYGRASRTCESGAKASQAIQKLTRANEELKKENMKLRSDMERLSAQVAYLIQRDAQIMASQGEQEEAAAPAEQQQQQQGSARVSNPRWRANDELSNAAGDANLLCSTLCPVSWIGDTVCDSSCNTMGCAFDGGDCGADPIIAGGMHGIPLTAGADAQSWSLPEEVTSFYIDLTGAFDYITDANHDNYDWVRTAIITQDLGVMTVLVHRRSETQTYQEVVEIELVGEKDEVEIIKILRVTRDGATLLPSSLRQ